MRNEEAVKILEDEYKKLEKTQNAVYENISDGEKYLAERKLDYSNRKIVMDKIQKAMATLIYGSEESADEAKEEFEVDKYIEENSP